jgi:hypothetical protein
MMHNSTDEKSRLRRGLFLLSCLVLVFTLGLCSCASIFPPLLPPSAYNKGDCEPVTTVNGRLCQDVASLSGLVPPRRAADAESLNKAAEYIAQEFGKTGCSVEKQSFPVDGKTYMNIICSFGPKEGERVIVGAHYDVDKDGTPGADDNASGVAGILELARKLSKEKPALARPFDLVAYSLEEEPYFGTGKMGSYYHAKSLADRNVRIKIMMSLEMIGYYSDQSDSQAYPVIFMYFSYPRQGNYIAVVGKCGQENEVSRVRDLMAKQGTIDVQSFTGPTILGGIDLSDHRNYWAFSYPAVMITDTSYYRNPNYHKETDTRQTLDFNRMAGVVEAVYAAMIGY